MRIAYDCPRPDCPFQISGSNAMNKGELKQTEDQIIRHIGGHEANSVTKRDNATRNLKPKMSKGAT